MTSTSGSRDPGSLNDRGTPFRKRPAATALAVATAIFASALLVPAAASAAVTDATVPDFDAVTGGSTTIEGLQLGGGSINDQVTTIYVYAEAGQSVAAQFQESWNSVEYAQVYDRDYQDMIRVEVIDPTGTVALDEYGTGTVGNTIGGAWTSDTTGVWAIRVHDAPYLNSSGTQLWHESSVDWNIGAFDVDGSLIPGNVFSESWAFHQSGSINPVPTVDFGLYGVNSEGAQYKLDLWGFNGIDSTMLVNNIGNAAVGTAESAYKSVPDASSIENNGSGANYWQPAQSGQVDGLAPFRLFIDEPNEDLPASTENWAVDLEEGSWLLPAWSDTNLTDLAYTRADDSSNAGSLTGTVTKSGTVTVSIDTNGNGDYSDDVDVVEEVQVQEAGTFSYEWDGRDGLGNEVPIAQETVNFHAELGDVSPIHVVRHDTETSTGGLTFTQLVGPNAGATTIYWDDSEFETTSDSRQSTTPEIVSGEAGVDSAGGVHGWASDDTGNRSPNANNGVTGSWGDLRAIDDWTYIEEGAEASTALSPIRYSDLAINKTAEGEPVIADNDRSATITWNVEVTNRGNWLDDAVSVTDTYPEQLIEGTVELVNGPSEGSFDAATGEWTGIELEPGEIADVTFSGEVSITPGQASTIANSASVTSSTDPYVPSEVCQANEDLASDTDQCDIVETPIEPQGDVDLAVVKQQDGEIVVAEDDESATLTWTVQGTNRGTVTATNVTVADTYPEQLVEGTIEVLNLSQGTFDEATGTVSGVVLAEGEIFELTFSAEIDITPGEATTVRNSVTISDPADPYEPTEVCQANDTLDTDTDQCDYIDTPIEPQGAPDLAVQKNTEGDPVLNGDGTATITWTVAGTNRGNVADSDVTIGDTYPEQIDIDTIEIVDGPSEGTFDTATGEWTGIELEPGEIVSVTFSAEVAVTAGEENTIANQAIITSPTDPYVPSEVCQINDTLAEDKDQCDIVTTVITPPAPVTPTPDEPSTPTATTSDNIGGIIAAIAGLLTAAGAALFLVVRKRRENTVDAK